jgi:hypothetical protein
VWRVGKWGFDDEKSKQQVAEGKLETGWKSPGKNFFASGRKPGKR